MADRTMKVGDTWPPLKGAATDENGLVDLTVATSLQVIIKSPTHEITGVPTVLNPPVQDAEGEWNWQYVWAAGDTANAGDYEVELKVTWQAGQLETFPNTGSASLTIEADI
jgi:hypothetical protein